MSNTHPKVFLENRARAAIKAAPNITQRDVAEMAGLEPSQLTKILNCEGPVDPNRAGGGPTIRALALIAWALGELTGESVAFGALFRLRVEKPRSWKRGLRSRVRPVA